MFAPQNTNYSQALAMSRQVIQQLKRKNQLEVFQEEINKKIPLGILVEVSDQELKEIMAFTHHFCYLSMVMSKSSASTQTRLINNTKTSVPGKGTSYCLENQMPRSQIGDSYDSLMDFRLYIHPYSSDISKCYLQVLVDNLTSKLRLMIWFRDPLNINGMIFF